MRFVKGRGKNVLFVLVGVALLLLIIFFVFSNNNYEGAKTKCPSCPEPVTCPPPNSDPLIIKIKTDIDDIKHIFSEFVRLKKGNTPLSPNSTYIKTMKHSYFFACRKLLIDIEKFNLDKSKNGKYDKPFQAYYNSYETIFKDLQTLYESEYENVTYDQFKAFNDKVQLIAGGITSILT